METLNNKNEAATTYNDWDKVAKDEAKEAKLAAREKAENEPEPETIADALADWRDAMEEDAKVAKIKMLADEPITKAMRAIRDEIAGWGHKCETFDVAPDNEHRIGFRARIGNARGANVTINIEKVYGNYRFNNVTGIEIKAEFDDGEGYGREHRQMTTYKADTTGKWNPTALKNRIAKKLEEYKAEAERRAAAEANKNVDLENKAAEAVELGKFLDATVEPLDADNSGYVNGKYKYDVNKTARKYACKLTERDNLTFQFNDYPADETCKIGWVKINANMTKDELKKLVDLVKTFGAAE